MKGKGGTRERKRYVSHKRKTIVKKLESLENTRD